MPLRSILIADDEESIRHVLTVLLADRGYEVRAVKDGEEALAELSSREYDALVTDVRMPKMDGLALVRAAQSAAPDTTIIVMSAYGSHDLAIEAMKAGAYDYLGKPFRPDEVLLVLRKAEERERLRAANRLLRREIARARGSSELVAGGAAMKEVPRLLEKVAPTSPPCSSRARAAPARSGSRAPCTSCRPAGSGRSWPSTAAPSPKA